MSRLVIVPEERHEILGAELLPRLAGIAREIDANNLVGVFYPEVIGMLEKAAAGFDGMLLVWAVEGRTFAPAWAADAVFPVIGKRVRADHGEGMVARAFGGGRGESAMAEELEIAEWCNLELVTGEKVTAMSVSPVHVFGSCVAVVSLTITKAAERTPLPPVEVSGLLARMIEDRILRAALGMDAI